MRDWLVNNDLKPEEGFETGDGPVDLYLGGRRVLIETKRGERLKNGPHSPGTGSRGNESAFDQLKRYVLAERRRERLHLDEDLSEQWIGCVTDSERWWIWVWPPFGSGDGHEAVHEFDGMVPDETQKERLIKRFGRLAGNEWAPADPTELFRKSLESLMNLYDRQKDTRGTKTQRGLWLEQLKAGGNAPESDAEEIFVIHTMLILISRLVSATVGGDRPIAEGFVQWVPADGPELMALKGIVDSYDWRQRTGDVLRALYIGYIPPQHRKTYGEYFTPDWLAEKVCYTVIDDGYLSQQVRRHQNGQPVLGVLDPSCGSGTFLYHAARMILESKAMDEEYLSPHEKAKFVCSMIHGMDIHPVAVEMARANMHRLLPNIPDDSIWVYQGDALLTQRPESRFHSMGGNNLALYSPSNLPLVLPMPFLKNMPGIDRFVRSASDDADMPHGLGSNLADTDLRQLREAHHQMRKIIREEANGVWAWYIRNQAAPILLREKKVGRIVSNAPWVRNSEIRVKTRKNEIAIMAKECGLWVGGENATSFNIASLFVDRCTDMYLAKPGKSGWVLQQGALLSSGWKGMRAKLGSRISGKWNLKRVPFKGSPTCAIFFGVPTPNRDLIKMPRAAIKSSSSWSTVKSCTKWKEWPARLPGERSSWMEKNGKKSMSRQGATLLPHCFVRINTKTVEGNNIRFETVPSSKHPWSEYGAQHGTVPSKWIHECLFFINLFPYLIPTTTDCILPILDGNRWDPTRLTNRYWQEAADKYVAKHGSGSGTPKTLEKCLNNRNKLFKQSKWDNKLVLYNKSGDVVHAARMTHRRIVNDGIYAVPCKSENEALFLTAILNADVMLPAFKDTRKSDRDFMAHLWKEVPIPRYDSSDPLHCELAELAKQAEQVSKNTWTSEYGVRKVRKTIRAALVDGGVSGQIDDACKRLFPDYV